MVSATPYFVSEYVLYSILVCFAYVFYALSHAYVKYYEDELSKNDWIQMCILGVLLLVVLISEIRIGGLFLLLGAYLTLSIKNVKFLYDMFK